MNTANSSILPRLSLLSIVMVLMFGNSACAVVPAGHAHHNTRYVASHTHYVTSDRPQVRHVAQRDVVVHKVVQPPVYVQGKPHGGKPGQSHGPSVSQKRPGGHNSGDKYTPPSHQQKQMHQVQPGNRQPGNNQSGNRQPGNNQSGQSKGPRDDRPSYSQVSHNRDNGPQSHAPGPQGSSGGRGKR